MLWFIVYDETRYTYQVFKENPFACVYIGRTPTYHVFLVSWRSRDRREYYGTGWSGKADECTDGAAQNAEATQSRQDAPQQIQERLPKTRTLRLAVLPGATLLTQKITSKSIQIPPP